MILSIYSKYIKKEVTDEEMIRNKFQKGFTLIELLVVIGIIGILAAIVLVAVNPGRQFAQARNQQRRADLLGITNAIYQFAAEHNGNIPATTYDVNGAPDYTAIDDCALPATIGTGGFNLAVAGDRDAVGAGAADAELIVPTYIAAIPTDPSTGSAADTAYTICTVNGRLTATAPDAELGEVITVTR